MSTKRLPAVVLTMCYLNLMQMVVGDCMHLATYDRPPSPPGYLDQLQPKSRSVPPLDPPLSTGNWPAEIKVKEPMRGWPTLPPESYWRQEVIMAVKVYKGVVYTSWLQNDTTNGRPAWAALREVALEQILAAIWLFKDFPDVDLYLNALDSGLGSKTDGFQMPFLQFSVFNTTSPSQEHQHHLPVHANQTAISSSESSWCMGQSRGFSIPHPDAWTQLSLSPGQLQFYSYCVHWYHGMGADKSQALYIKENAPSGSLDAGGTITPRPVTEATSVDHSSKNTGGEGDRTNAMAPAQDGTHVATPGLLNDYGHSERAAWWWALRRYFYPGSRQGGRGRRSTGRAPAPGPDADIGPFLRMTHQRNWAETHKPVALWRGSTTGGIMGWDHQVLTQYLCYNASSPPHEPSFFESSLLNKRTSAAMAAAHHPWLDIGITRFYHQWTRGWINSTHEQAFAKQLDKMLIKPGVDLEAWSGYQLTLSFDGHGPPYRLPKQLLGMTPVLKVETIQREWFANDLVPYVHYIPVAFDLHNMAAQAHHLLAEAQHDSRHLQSIAIAARNVMVDRLHVLAQLDATMWSIMRLKEVLQYEVQPPTAGEQWAWGEEKGWAPLQLPHKRTWLSPSLHHIGANIAAAMPQNFV